MLIPLHDDLDTPSVGALLHHDDPADDDPPEHNDPPHHPTPHHNTTPNLHHPNGSPLDHHPLALLPPDNRAALQPAVNPHNPDHNPPHPHLNPPHPNPLTPNATHHPPLAPRPLS